MTAMSRRLLVVVALVSLGWPVAAAQSAPGAPDAPDAPGAPVAPAAPAAGEPFSYRSEGRRDPFVSLLARGADTRASLGRRVDGPAGLAVSEISVRGVLKTPDGFVAILQGPDNKAFLVRPHDRLLDGTITAITPQGLVILQEVTDPFSHVKRREVRKGLRSAEEGT